MKFEFFIPLLFSSLLKKIEKFISPKKERKLSNLIPDLESKNIPGWE